MSPKDDFLDERQRAEDILLGSLGFAEEAKIVFVERAEVGYRGTGAFTDGERFEFSSEEELGELEEWALSILVKK
jgi:hypothetical protein